jgi:hypothetical protein
MSEALAVAARRSLRTAAPVRRGAGLCVVALSLLSGPARAAAPPTIVTVGECPRREQLATALAALLRTGEPASSAQNSSGQRLSVEDLGARYRVSLQGEGQENVLRDYDDEARDCAERARIAALFAAVTLEPPEVAARRKSVAAAPAPNRYELRLGASTALGLQSPLSTAFGAELRGALLVGRWGIELGAGAFSPAHLSWRSYEAAMTRFPFDVSVRGSLHAGPVAAGLSAGVAPPASNTWPGSRPPAPSRCFSVRISVARIKPATNTATASPS